jgi:glycosyltransferase involved in cell wall biosynthesis
LHLIGDGPERARLTELARALGIGRAAVFSGELPSADVPDALARAWALAVPSVMAESCGMSGLEALAHGVPVIAGATGALADEIETGVNGLLFPNGDEHALASALVELAGKPPVSVAPEVVQRTIERHRGDHHLETLRGILRQVARRAASAQPPAERPSATASVTA